MQCSFVRVVMQGEVSMIIQMDTWEKMGGLYSCGSHFATMRQAGGCRGQVTHRGGSFITESPRLTNSEHPIMELL